MNRAEHRALDLTADDLWFDDDLGVMLEGRAQRLIQTFGGLDAADSHRGSCPCRFDEYGQTKSGDPSLRISLL